MKNIFKNLGIIAFVAVIGFSMVACVPPTGDGKDGASTGTIKVKITDVPSDVMIEMSAKRYGFILFPAGTFTDSTTFLATDFNILAGKVLASRSTSDQTAKDDVLTSTSYEFYFYTSTASGSQYKGTSGEYDIIGFVYTSGTLESAVKGKTWEKAYVFKKRQLNINTVTPISFSSLTDDDKWTNSSP